MNGKVALVCPTTSESTVKPLIDDCIRAIVVGISSVNGVCCLLLQLIS